MNLQEFKAWFEGFSENLDGPPDEKKWERIKAKIAQIDGTVTSYPVFIRDYWRPYYTNHFYSTYCGGALGDTPMNGVAHLNAPQVVDTGFGNGTKLLNPLTNGGKYHQSDSAVDLSSSSNMVVSLDAWRASGRAEAQAVGAA